MTIDLAEVAITLSMDNSGKFALTAVHNGLIVGQIEGSRLSRGALTNYALVIDTLDRECEHALITRLEIVPEHRGCGIATKLLFALKNYQNHNQLNAIIKVDGNPGYVRLGGMIKLMQRCGFDLLLTNHAANSAYLCRAFI